MKCYEHPDVDAVGICAVCRRGICRESQVIMQGRRYCKDDAARILRTKPQLKRPQVAPTSVLTLRSKLFIWTSILLTGISGLSGLVVGLLLVFLGMFSGGASAPFIQSTSLGAFLNYFAAVLSFPAIEAMELGLVTIFLGAADLGAAYYLRFRYRMAGLLSIFVAVLGAGFVGTYLVIAALAGPFVLVWFVLEAAKVAAILLSWRNLGRWGKVPVKPVMVKAQAKEPTPATVDSSL